LLESRHLLAANPLDATFDLDGLSTTSFDQFFEQFTRITHAPNGKIYAVGNIQSQWLIARYTAGDGMLDMTFDGDGFKLLPMANFSAPSAVIAQADGKLLIGGTTGGNAAVVRLTATGALDNTWSDDGIWTGAWAGRTTNSLAGLQVLDGKLYAAGDDLQGLYLSRFNDNGTLDTTYGGANTGTYAFLPPTGSRPQARGLELVPAVSTDPFDSFEGPKLAFLGQYFDTQTRGLLAEFYADGDIATPFGTNGVTTFAATGGLLSTLATDEFGRIIVGGAVAQVASVFRFTDHGAPDTSFSGDGVYVHPSAFGVNAVSAALGRGGIVFAGAFSSGAVPTSRLVALTDAGELDTSFGTNGVFTRSGMARFSDAIPTGDGKVVFAGTVFYSDDQRNTQLARVTFDPQPNTTVSGAIFNDLDGDGVQDIGESNYAGFGISAYLDLNHNGVFDSFNEPSSYAGNTGNYSFAVNPGTYTVRITGLAAVDQRQTTPANNGGVNVTAVANENTLAGLFGVQRVYGVPGFVFNDLDGNGHFDIRVIGSDTTIPGRTVYADANNNGFFESNEVSAVTDQSGRYVLMLPQGNHRLRQILPAGWIETGRETDSINSQFATTGIVAVPTDLDSVAVRNFYFGSQLTAIDNGSIAGLVFDDADDDGSRDAGEAGLPNVRVYIDITNNAVFDSGTDPSVLTATDGSYAFTKLLAGTYNVRSVVATGRRSTTPINNVRTVNLPTNQVSTNNDFGHTARAALSGFVFHDVNGNGVNDGETVVGAGWQAYLDANGNAALDAGELSTFTDPHGAWTFHNLAPGAYSVRVIPLAEWRITTPLPINATLTAGAWPVVRMTGVAQLPAQLPYKGNPFAVGATPVTIQAEDYDLGGQGIAFNDTTANNIGGFYRPGEAVDIKSHASGQFRISDGVAGEWLEYSIEVATAGNYELEFRVSHADPNSKFHADVDGVNATGSLTAPDTNSFNTFASVKKTVALTAGKHVLQFAFDANAANGYAASFDWVKVTAVTNEEPPPPPPPPPPPGGTVTIGNTIGAYVRNGSFAGTNYGNDGQLIVKRSATSGNTRESYLRFDLSTLPTDPAAIIGVKLRVWGRQSATGTGVNVAAYSISNTSWSETGITWNNKPAAGATAIQTRTITGTTGTWYEWDVTNLVKQARQNGQSLVTLALRATNTTDPQALFNSDDATSNKPELVAQTSTPTAPTQAIVVDNDALALPEGGTASFTVKLAAAPTSDVIVTISKQAGSDPDVSANKTTLTFTPANWNVAQAVTLSAAEDADSTNNQSFFSVASTGLSTVTVLALEQDNDGPVSEPTVFMSEAATVRNGTYASQNFGTATELVVKRSANTGNTRETYLRFDFSSIESVTTAKLRINARLSDTSIASLLTQIYSVSNTTWTESGLTWNNKPTTSSTLRGSFTVTGTNATWYEIDLTSFIQAEFAAGRKVVTLVLRNPNVSDAQTLIPSDETVNGPQLIV
jgi:uncharacterized delta-60 repeat protein